MTAITSDADRAAFELWAIKTYELKSAERHGNGYRFSGVDDAWGGWQAALAYERGDETSVPNSSVVEGEEL